MCDYVCILGVVAIEFLSRTSSKELSAKAAIALNYALLGSFYACAYTSRMRFSRTAFCDWTQKKKKIVNRGKHWRQEKKSHKKAQPIVFMIFLPHFDLIFDLLLNRRTAT